jgi:hypothetical protein
MKNCVTISNTLKQAFVEFIMVHFLPIYESPKDFCKLQYKLDKISGHFCAHNKVYG